MGFMMKQIIPTFFLLPRLIAGQQLLQASLAGPQYPAPTQLSSEPKFKAAVTAINTTLNKNAKIFPYNETTFSLGFFSTHANGLLYEYNHQSTDFAKLSHGTLDVNADSIYALGSISKLLTTYVTLINQSDSFLSKSVAEILPELTEIGSTSWNPLTPDWTEITIGDLAAHQAGLARDYGLADISAKSFALANVPLPPLGTQIPWPASFNPAFPPIPKSEVPVCGYETANYSLVPCTAEAYLNGAATASQIYANAHIPVYSNMGFAILGLAVSNATGTSFESLFNATLVKQLGLSHTFYGTPDGLDDQGVIPGDPTLTGWKSQFGVFAPAGAFLSTVNDMATIGKAILKNTLLSPSQTRRWLKPAGFTSDMAQGVGRPWEIFRRTINGHTVDLYTKGGDWGQYATEFLLFPDYDFGLTFLTAADFNSSARSALQFSLPSYIADILLPALDEIAKDQASLHFAGTYVSKNGSSSISIAADQSPALKVTEWINNGVNLTDFFVTKIAGPFLDYRIYPNQLGKGNSVGFASSYLPRMLPVSNASWLFYDGSWADLDELTNGNIPLGQFFFETDDNGDATAVELRSLRTTLQKQK